MTLIKSALYNQIPENSSSWIYGILWMTSSGNGGTKQSRGLQVVYSWVYTKRRLLHGHINSFDERSSVASGKPADRMAIRIVYQMTSGVSERIRLQWATRWRRGEVMQQNLPCSCIERVFV